MGAFIANSLSIRSAMLGDAESLATIYAPYVRDTAVSFEVVPPTTAEFVKRIEAIQEHFWWAYGGHKQRGQKHKPLTSLFMVGVTRF